MKILVIGGMHGNEPLGLEVVKLFQDKQVKNIDTVLANKLAIKQNRRFINQDLNRSFPGDIFSRIYEQNRAAYILSLCKRYDLVIDFHNTYCPNNDCSFIGESAENNLYWISSYLKLNRIIVANYDCLNKYAPNCISIEISLKSRDMNAGIWYKKIQKLSTMNSISSSGSIEKFRFVYRMTLEDRDKFDLKLKNLQAFKPISRKLAKGMNVKSPAYPIFIEDKYTPYNYGGLLNKA